MESSFENRLKRMECKLEEMVEAQKDVSAQLHLLREQSQYCLEYLKTIMPAGTIVYEMPQAKIQKPTQSTSQDDPNTDLPNPHLNHGPTETSARRSKDNGEFPSPNHRSSSKSSTHRVNTKTVPKITSVVSLQPRVASEYLYNCSNCPSQFNNKKAAKLHTKNCPNSHGSKIPKLGKLINCQFCSRSFPTIHQVRSHERVHTKDRPFSCYVCELKFAHGGNLVKHIKAMHRGYNSYICRYCLQTFKTHVELQDHRKVCDLYHKDCQQRRAGNNARTRNDSLDSAGRNISEDTDTASEPDDDNYKPARTFVAAGNFVANAITKRRIELINGNRTENRQTSEPDNPRFALQLQLNSNFGHGIMEPTY